MKVPTSAGCRSVVLFLTPRDLKDPKKTSNPKNPLPLDFKGSVSAHYSAHTIVYQMKTCYRILKNRWGGPVGRLKKGQFSLRGLELPLTVIGPAQTPLELLATLGIKSKKTIKAEALSCFLEASATVSAFDSVPHSHVIVENPS